METLWCVTLILGSWISHPKSHNFTFVCVLCLEKHGATFHSCVHTVIIIIMIILWTYSGPPVEDCSRGNSNKRIQSAPLSWAGQEVHFLSLFVQCPWFSLSIWGLIFLVVFLILFYLENQTVVNFLCGCGVHMIVFIGLKWPFVFSFPLKWVNEGTLKLNSSSSSLKKQNTTLFVLSYRPS